MYCVLCGSRRLTDSSLPYVCVRYLCVCVLCGSRRLTDSSLPYVCVRYLCVCTVCCVVAGGSLMTRHTSVSAADVNECVQTPAPCRYDCENSDGSYRCLCPTGFVLDLDGSSCKDLDECATGQHVCQHECINTQGSYRCSCPDGYRQLGDQCMGQ